MDRETDRDREATEAANAGEPLDPQVCEWCEGAIPDGEGTYMEDLSGSARAILCPFCSPSYLWKLGEGFMTKALSPCEICTGTIRAEDEPGEDEKERD